MKVVVTMQDGDYAIVERAVLQSRQQCDDLIKSIQVVRNMVFPLKKEKSDAK